jgi:tetratricopeptide (TPR) repeat protein
LFSFQLRRKKLTDAKATLEKLAKCPKLSGAQRLVTLGQGYEALGDSAVAEEHYQQAARLAPDDVEVQLRYAALLMQTNAGEAETLLKQLAPKSQTARRSLALLYAFQGGEEKWNEAHKLLASDAGEARGPLDDRLQAILLARQPASPSQKRERVAKAREILERLVNGVAQPTDVDRLMLASLYEGEGKLQSAREHYRALVGREQVAPTHLGLYVNFLLRHNDQAEAGERLDQLERLTRAGKKGSLEPNLGVLGLRARWLAAEKRNAEIEPLIEGAVADWLNSVGDSSQQAQATLSIGSLYSNVDLHIAAQRWYERHLRVAPDNFEPLVQCLAAQGKIAEALKICLAAAKDKKTPRPAISLATIMLGHRLSAGDQASAEKVVKQALADHPNDVDLLMAVGGLRATGQQSHEAIALYRRALKLAPQHVTAINNLATLLGESPQTAAEAIELIERAIAIGGRQAPLLDTKGTIHLYAGEAEQAVAELEEAASGSQDPRCQFHLAAAYFGAKRRDEARTALKKAMDGGLQDQILTPADRQLLTRMEQELRLQASADQ